MLKVAIRTDASLYIGSGHVMRCLVLADALKRKGHDVVFLTRPQPGDLISLIKQRGFSVCELSKPSKWLVPQTTADYAAWLQVNEIDDAKECTLRLERVDLVIVDHYGIGIQWHKKVRKAYGCKVLVIDDLVREHDADLIVDQTLLRTADEYLLLNPAATALTGTDYAIIHANFAKYHAAELANLKKLSGQPRVLVSMGGVDAPNASLQVLKALKQGGNMYSFVTVLLSSRAPHYQEIKNFAEQESEWLTHIDFVDNMAEFISQYDIIIGAPGSTSWERACLGIPSIIIVLADNQQTICSNLTSVGAAISVDIGAIEKSLINAFLQVCANHEQMRRVNLKLCDGMGLNRIMQKIEQIFSDSLTLRPATLNDIQQVYDWQCAPETRRYALNKTVPGFSEHQAWMSRKISSKDDYFYIIEKANATQSGVDAVGVLRLDMTSRNTYTISIFVSPVHFGNGIAKRSLRMLDSLHPNAVINAVVLKHNTASHALFRRAGYVKVDEENYTRQAIE